MIEFSRFDEFGRYTSTVSCPESCLEFEDKDRIYIGQLNSNDYYHDLTSNLPVRKPNKPSKFHVFDYVTKQWHDPRTPDTEWPMVRAERDRRLLSSDWTQLPDVPLTTKEAWAAYRQALRDITEQPDPFNITWPVVPG